MKSILIFIHKFNDIDHLSPIAYSICKYTNIKVNIISLLPFKNHKKDFRILYLLKNNNVKFYNFTNFTKQGILFLFIKKIIENGSFNKTNLKAKKIFESKNFFPFKIIPFLFKKTILSIFFYIIYYTNTYLKFVKIFCSNNWVNLFFHDLNPSLIIYDHGVTTGNIRNISPNIEIINYARNKKIPIVSVPHGVPLFKNHPPRYDKVKQNLIDDKSDYLILQHQHWKNECIEKGMVRKNVHILGIPRFSDEWTLILKEIATNEKHLSLKNSSKIKVVFMDSGPNNYGQRINLLDKTIDYLKNDKNIEFLYKPHTRNNKKHYRNSSISIANEINSINLIKWADIIIGSTSSIMINVLQLKKIFILPSYLLDKKMLFQEYKACIDLKNLNELKKFIKKYNTEKLTFKDCFDQKNLDNFIGDIVYNKFQKTDLLKNYADFLKKIVNDKTDDIYKKIPKN